MKQQKRKEPGEEPGDDPEAPPPAWVALLMRSRKRKTRSGRKLEMYLPLVLCLKKTFIISTVLVSDRY